MKRIVYDDLGNPEWIVPLPEFSNLYGNSYEEQVQRLANNLAMVSTAEYSISLTVLAIL